MAYFSGLRVVDATYGLTDKVVARQRFEQRWIDQTREEYFRQLNPESIIGGDRAGGVGKDSSLTGGREYRFVRQFPQGEGQQWYLYERADIAHERADLPRQ